MWISGEIYAFMLDTEVDDILRELDAGTFLLRLDLKKPGSAIISHIESNRVIVFPFV
jgi:hypothetical protein